MNIPNKSKEKADKVYEGALRSSLRAVNSRRAAYEKGQYADKNAYRRDVEAILFIIFNEISTTDTLKLLKNLTEILELDYDA